jgi:hypothetical protein
MRAELHARGPNEDGALLLAELQTISKACGKLLGGSPLVDLDALDRPKRTTDETGKLLLGQI